MFDCSILVEDEDLLVSSDGDGGWWEPSLMHQHVEYKRRKPSEAATVIFLL